MNSGEMLACGTCLKLRHSEGSDLSPSFDDEGSLRYDHRIGQGGVLLRKTKRGSNKSVDHYVSPAADGG